MTGSNSCAGAYNPRTQAGRNLSTFSTSDRKSCIFFQDCLPKIFKDAEKVGRQINFLEFTSAILSSLDALALG